VVAGRTDRREAVWRGVLVEPASDEIVKLAGVALGKVRGATVIDAIVAHSRCNERASSTPVTSKIFVRSERSFPLSACLRFEALLPTRRDADEGTTGDPFSGRLVRWSCLK